MESGAVGSTGTTGSTGSTTGTATTGATGSGTVGSTTGGTDSTTAATTSNSTMGSTSAGGMGTTGSAESTDGATTSMGGAGGTGGDASGGVGGTGVGGVGGGDPTDTSSEGCGTTISRPDPNVQQTMESGGATRYYLLNVPENADNQTPLMLILALHGYDMNNVALKGHYNFTQRSGGQAITVLPQGEGPPPGDVSHWGDGVLQSTWNAGDTNYNYLRELIDDLSARYCIDTSRIFITGFSMGGFFTNAIACAHSDWFRGFAPIAGGGPNSCADDVRSPIMISHGTADDIVEISSGEGSRDFWIDQNGCGQSSSASYSGCQSYEGCADDGPVHWCVGNFNHTVDGTIVGNIWEFFSGL